MPFRAVFLFSGYLIHRNNKHDARIELNLQRLDPRDVIEASFSSILT
jgi:hypothetical protein